MVVTSPFFPDYFQDLLTHLKPLTGPSCCCSLITKSCIWLFCDPMNYSPPGFSVHGISQIRDQSWSQEKRKCWRVSHWGFLCHIPVAANHQKYQNQILYLGMLTFRFWRPLLTINNILLVPGFLATFVSFYLWWAVVWGLHVHTSSPFCWPEDLARPVPMTQAAAQGPVICWQITQAIHLLAHFSNSTCSEIFHCSALSTCQVISFLVLNFSR